MRCMIGPITKSFTAIIICVTVLSTCGLNKNEGSYQPLQSIVLFKIDNAPAYVEEDPGDLLEIELLTLKKYPCRSCLLLSNLTLRGDTIAVELRGVQIPDNCNAVAGPARSTHLLELSPGQYNIVFQYGDQIDTYELEVSSQAIEIVKDVANITRPLFNVIRR